MLGPQYSGTKVTRDAWRDSEDNSADESENSFQGDDIEGSGSEDGEEDEGDSEFDDPDTIDFEAGIEEDVEIDSDEAFGEGDEQTFRNFSFSNGQGVDGRTKGRTRETQAVNKEMADDEEEDGVKQSDESDDNISAHGMNTDTIDTSHDLDSDSDGKMDDESSDGSVDSEPDSSLHKKATSSDRTAIRAMMASEQKSVVDSISAATRADAAKGRAVKRQRAGFDMLLNTRIRLQKALVATNSLSAQADAPMISSPSDKNVIEAAETAALSLLGMLTGLRESLPSPSATTSASRKRPFQTAVSTATSDIHESLLNSARGSLPNQRATLDKWAQKTHIASALPTHDKFAQTKIPSLTSVLDEHLFSGNLDRLVKRTQIPRSCAPLQAAKDVEDESIYDDADWYALLLQDLVDTKMSASASANAQPHSSLSSKNAVVDTATALAGLRRETKTHRRGVDTKASKGRKMRYTVHEKLQNFMAPQDLGTWGERQMDELFGGLLGRRVKGGLEEGVGGGSESEDLDVDGETEGLKLFAGNR